MTITPAGYSLLLLTAMVGALAAVVVFAVLRFLAAAHDTRRSRRGDGMETARLGGAAGGVVKLRAQERATARARGPERLSGEIILEPHLRAARRRVERRDPDPQPRGAAHPRGARVADVRGVSADRARERPLFRSRSTCLRRRVAMSAARSCCARISSAGSRHASRRRRFAALGRKRAAARSDLPLHRSHGGDGPRRAAAVEGQPGDGGGADGRHRARVPERAGDDSRL